MVRIVFPYSMTHFFLDGAAECGIYAAMGRRLEGEINQRQRHPPVTIDAVNELLEPDEILELVPAGFLPAVCSKN
jgi:hypothetical protein